VSNTQAILIAGATSSGKSALALRLAQTHDGVVTNADSMQVYRDLRVITGAADASRGRTGTACPLWPYRCGGKLFGCRWCRDAQAGDWRSGAGRAAADPRRRNGPLFQGAAQGLASVPSIPADIRSVVRGRLTSEGVAALHADLAQRDPATAQRIMVGDRARVTRALEVVLATGRSLADWHREGMPPSIDAARAIKIFLAVERAELYRRINERFDTMLSSGALEEVRALAARNLDPMLPAMKAHGVPWLIRHLKGEITLEEAAEGGKRDNAGATPNGKAPGFAINYRIGPGWRQMKRKR